MIRSGALRVVALAAAAALPAVAQPGFKPKKSKIPEADIDRAVERGVAWLKKTAEGGRFPDDNGATCQELVLYTLHHGGLSRSDPVFLKLLQYVVDKDPNRTYSAALAAMCLSALDKAGYQWKLAHLAQFLVDNQCRNGQWLYGEPVPLDKPAAPAVASPVATSTGAGGPGAPATDGSTPLYGTHGPGSRDGTKAGPAALLKPLVRVSKLRVLQRRRGPESGDHSNSQYAALGLRACAEANIEPDPKCLNDALQSWEMAQCVDGGWDYKEAAGAGYGGMTAGAISSITIYHWLLGRPFRDNPAIGKGFQWFAKYWDVTRNPRADAVKPETGRFIHYYLYGLERVGMIYGTNAIGGHDWYDEGAKHLLQTQQPDGSWQEPSVDVWNTCFAVLFLRRATKPLLPKVYTGP